MADFTISRPVLKNDAVQDAKKHASIAEKKPLTPILPDTINLHVRAADTMQASTAQTEIEQQLKDQLKKADL